MKINGLKCSHFRNLSEQEFLPNSGINVIYGNNAQGKTNLLEGMWLFTGGRSFRGAKDSELIAFGETSSTLLLHFFSEERDQEAEILISNRKRSATVNHINLKSASSLIGKFCAVLFSPEHLSLVKDGPSIRRNFIDSALCQIKPTYAKVLYYYNKTLLQRNSLLKDIPKHSELLDTLDIWDQKLAHYGSEIVKERFYYIENLKDPARMIYHGISQGQEEINISYLSDILENNNILESFIPKMIDQLKKVRKEDMRAGFTTVGPHRDDIDITLNLISAKSYASQGQQRSIVLSLKLAEAQILKEKINEPPIIFLDDVMSELDANRQNYLLNHLEGQQVFITCCEPESFSSMNGGKTFEMSHGMFLK